MLSRLLALAALASAAALVPAQSALNAPSNGTSVQAGATDPRTVLQEAISAAGGAQPLSALTQVSGTGTIVYHLGSRDVSGTSTLSWSASSGLSLETVTPHGKRTLASTASSETSVDERGREFTFGSHNAARTLFKYLPCLELALILNNSSAVVQNEGVVSLSGETVDAIVVSGFWPSRGNSSGNDSVIYYLDHTTHFVVRRDDSIEMSPSGPGRLPRTMLYSSYQSVAGLSLPTAISEILNQQPLYSLTVTQLNAH